MDIQEDAPQHRRRPNSLNRTRTCSIGGTSLDELIAFQVSKFTDLASLAHEEAERAMFFAEQAKLLAEESFKLGSEEEPKGKESHRVAPAIAPV